MKPMLLIAFNFVREQRWPIFVLLLWVLLLAFLGLVADIPRMREDLLFLFKQVAVYVVAFSIFFGGSAIYNERKSRRILAVLSKAVRREQYLSGWCSESRQRAGFTASLSDLLGAGPWAQPDSRYPGFGF